MKSGSVKFSNRINNPEIALQKVHVLILDSSVHVTSLFKKMMEKFGFTNVFTANNGFHGVQILREVKINLIITDWHLNPINSAEKSSNVISHTDILPVSGIDFVKRLRWSPASPNPYIPIIMFADTVEKMQVISARDAGINEICIKPLSAEELCQRIIAVIDNPRIFITASTYKGPCRRRKALPLDTNNEKRKKEIRIIKYADSSERN
jgi:DNA-binding response OmpR family regulator